MFFPTVTVLLCGPIYWSDPLLGCRGCWLRLLLLQLSLTLPRCLFILFSYFNLDFFLCILYHSWCNYMYGLNAFHLILEILSAIRSVFSLLSRQIWCPMLSEVLLPLYSLILLFHLQLSVYQITNEFAALHRFPPCACPGKRKHAFLNGPSFPLS